LIRIHSDLDPSQLPWPSELGMISLPIDEVREISSVIHLHR
jgi:hypothetical protein